MLTLGVPASVHPTADPVGDVQWADAQPGIAAVWFIDHLQGWLPRGVDSGWLGDPHALFDPFSVMAAAAAQSSRVTLALGVTDPLRRAPAVALQAALSVSWLGRRPMLLGIGAGAPENLRPYGLERGGRVAYVREACETITSLRDAEVHDGGGPTWPRQRATVGLGAHAGMQLWVGAHGPQMLDVTARYGDGWLPAKLSPRNFASLLQSLREKAERIGRDPDSIRTGMFAWAALAPTRRESDALLLAPVVRATALYRPPAAYKRHGAAHPLGDDQTTPDYIPSHFGAEEARRLVESIPQAVVRDAVVCGSVDDVRRLLGDYEEAGCEHVALYDVGRYVDAEGLQRSRECLAALAAGRDGGALLGAGSARPSSGSA
jgi:phthiodiolone/phenolphthiodiolone dimycocerosates ketoreductase